MPTSRQGREPALQALYAVAVGHREPGDALTEIVGDGGDTEYRAFVKDLVFGTLDHADEADLLSAPLLEGWTIERLPTIDRLVLQMGAFELRHRPKRRAQWRSTKRSSSPRVSRPKIRTDSSTAY